MQEWGEKLKYKKDEGWRKGEGEIKREEKSRQKGGMVLLQKQTCHFNEKIKKIYILYARYPDQDDTMVHCILCKSSKYSIYYTEYYAEFKKELTLK